MTTRKSGLLGLALAVGLLSACESKDVTVVVPPESANIIVTVQPNPTNLVLGGTPSSQQMTATVSGAANTVTWSIAGTAATINATGLVTAAAVGQAVVTATSTVNANARGSATVIVTQGTSQTPPSISISTVTQGGTLFPVVTNNVMGQIDVVANLDVPTGVAIDSITFDLDNGAIPIPNCKQTFTATGSADLGINAAEPVTIVCSINTAEVVNDTLGVPRFLNGPHVVRARIFRPGGAAVIAATSQQLTFNNPNFVRTFSNITGNRSRTDLAGMFSKGCAVATSVPGPGNLAPGAQWCGGDLRMRFVPTIFTNVAADRPNTYTVTLTTNGGGSNGTSACLATQVAPAVAPNPGPPGCGAAVISKASSAGPTVNSQVVDTINIQCTVGSTVCGSLATTTATNDIVAVEDIISNITIVSANSTSGLAGPACVNPDPATNPLVAFGGGTGAAFPNCGTGFGGGTPSAPNTWFLANTMKIDNLAPRATLFDFTPATMGCTQTACFITGTFPFTERAGFYTTVDYGVDGQTATFDAAPQATWPTGLVANVATGAALPETGTPNWIVQAKSVDRLQNASAFFAHPTVATTPINVVGTPSAATIASAQPIGIDKTAPRVLSFTGVANNGTDNDEVGNVVTITFVDTAVAPAGPSGFPTTPATATLTRINAAGSTAVASGLACAGQSCTVTIPDATTSATSGYFTLVVTVRDAAFPGNQTGATPNTSAPSTLVYLDDEQPPILAGVTAPSTITAAPVTFTADATDNVELGDVIPSISYGNSGNFYAHVGLPSIGSYGISPLDFSRTAATGNALSVTMNPFIYSMEHVTAANAPLGDAAFAQAINFAVRDVAGVQLNVACPAPGVDGAIGEVAPVANRSNCIQRQNNDIRPNVQAGVGSATPVNYNTATLTPAPAQNILTFLQQPITRASGTTTLTAEATGPQGTFTNPFPSGVNFYRYDAVQTRWIFIVTTTSAVAFDDDVQAVRRWRYVATVPDASVPAGATVRAIGVNAGRGLIAQNTDRIAPPIP